jgi:phosphoglycolate phosphatase-like HAD superfamily hydrolase
MAGAYIKLSAVGLYYYFAVGAFGSDHEDRNMLPPIAIERAQHYYGTRFKKEDVWIVGDSIHDVRCAKANGLKSIALPTGFTPESLLLDENPDHLLENLNDVEQIRSIIGFD